MLTKKELAELQELFKSTAEMHTPEGIKAFRLFTAALGAPILQTIELESVMRQMFTVINLAAGAQPMFPIDTDFDLPVWYLPGLGEIAHNFIEGVGEEIYVPTFSIDTSAEWKVSYARDGRVDIAMRAADKAAKAIAEFEEESGWSIILPAATSTFSGKGLLGPRPAPIYEISPLSDGSGYFSPQLINKMMVGFKRLGMELTDIYLSPEDAADIREWTDTEIDPVTRREVFKASGMGSVWNVEMHELQHLGATGKYNINGYESEWGRFFADSNEDFNAYHLDNPNVVDGNGVVSTLGETQIIGVDKNAAKDSLVMPIRKPFETYDDPSLLRKQKAGFYGWEELGMACLDSRALGLGVIDRSL